MSTTFDRRSLAEQVAARLHGLIADGTYAPGARLPQQRELAASLGVSIAVVREALALLTAAGLVRSRHGHGTFVEDKPDATLRFPVWIREPESPAALAEAIEARTVIEHAMARLAAERATADDVQRLRRCVEDMRATVADRAAFREHDLALHLALMAAARNRPLAGALLALQQLVREMIGLFAERAEAEHRMEALVAAHAELVDCVAAGDAAAAAACMDAMMEELRREAERRGAIPAEADR